MRWLHFSGLRARLILVVAVAGLLPFVSLVSGVITARRAAEDRVEQETQRAANQFAEQLNEAVTQARLTLIDLAHVAQLRRGNPPECNDIYSDIYTRYLQQALTLDNIGLISPEGHIYCAVKTISGPVNVADRPYFQRALHSSHFVVGNYVAEAATGKSLLYVAYPLAGYAATPRAVFFAALNLEWLNALYEGARLPTDSVFMLLDSNQRIVLRYPVSEINWEGRLLADLTQEEAVVSGMDVDNTQRLFASATLADDPAGDVRVVVGVSTAPVYANANADFGRNLVGLVVIVLVMFAAAWFGSEFFILRHLQKVLRATQRVRQGDLSARTGIASGGIGEVEELAHAFDAMSVALEMRERERVTAETAMRRILAETQRRASELEALYQITHAAATQQNLSELLQQIVKRAAQLLNAESGLLFLYDEHAGDLQLVVAHGPAMPVGHRIALGEGLMGGVARDHLPRILDANSVPTHRERHLALSTLAIVPLLYGGHMMGVIGVGGGLTRPVYTEEDVRLLTLVAGHAASAIYGTRLLEAETLARQTAEALRAAALALSQNLELDNVLAIVLEHLRGLVPCDAANVLLLEDDRRLVYRGLSGYEELGVEALVRALAWELDTAPPVVRHVLTTQTSLLVADTHIEPNWRRIAGLELNVRSWLGVPLVAGGRVLGLYSLDKAEAHFFTSAHQRLAEAMAVQAAIAIQNARLYEEVRAGQQRLRQLAQQVVVAQEEERQRVSRELHDEAGQALVGLKLQLDLVRETLPPAASPFMRHIENTEKQIEMAMQRIRALARNLRPQALDTVGLRGMLEDLCLDYGERAQLSIHYRGIELPGLAGDVSIGLYRIAQEALTNVAKHAHAQTVRVELGREHGNVFLLVEDDGRGFDWAASQWGRPGSGMGLWGMRERVQFLNGTLDFTSTPGRGTLVVARVPWAESGALLPPPIPPQL